MVLPLRRLERVVRSYGGEVASGKLALLRELEREKLSTAREVSRLHEALCWLSAYPDDATVLAQVERMLGRFAERADLRRQRDTLVDSGIAGTTTCYRFFWPLALWLARSWPGLLELEWDDDEAAERLRRSLPLVVSPSESETWKKLDWQVQRSLEHLKGGATDATFFVERVAALAGDAFTREAFHDAIDMGYRLVPGPGTPSRTTARYERSAAVFRSAPLERTRPDLGREIARPPRAVRKVSLVEGRKLVDLARGAMVTRSRDLEAFGYGDPRDVRLVEDGAGLAFALIGVVPERRLLLHATYGLLTLQNGVPIGYAQADALCRSVAVSYNTFETFRGGEAARVFGRLLSALSLLFGAATFSIEPYQLGLDNEEGLSSGAWWFYYKLGFRPRDREVLRVLEGELARQKRKPGYRSDRTTLERLAAAHLFFASGSSGKARVPPPPWNGVGLSIARSLGARGGGGDRTHALRQCAEDAARLLDVPSLQGWSFGERQAWDRFAPLVASLPDLAQWSAEDRQALVRVICAKGGRRESEFVARFDAHPRLRRAVLELEKRGWKVSEARG